MYNKLIICYSVFLTFNCCSAIKFQEKGDLSKLKELLNIRNVTVNQVKDVWQPITQKRYSLPTATMLTPALLAATETIQKPYAKNILSTKIKEKHTFTLSNAVNYGKQFTKPLKLSANLTTHSILRTPKESYIKLKPYFHPFNKQNNYDNANQSKTYQFNVDKNQYPQIRVTKNIIQREQEQQKLHSLSQQNANQSSSKLLYLNNFKHFGDVAKQNQHTNPSLYSLSFWLNSPQAKQIAAVKNYSKNTFQTIDFPIKISDGNNNKMDNILPTILSSLLTGNDLNENMKNLQYQNNGRRALKTDNKKAEAGKVFKMAAANESFDSTKKFSNDPFNIFKKFSDWLKPKISNEIAQLKANNNADKRNDAEIVLSRIATYDDIDLEMFILTAQHVIKATSKALSAAVAESVKNLPPFQMKNIFTSLTATAAKLFLPVLQDVNESKSEINLDKFATTGSNKLTQLRNISSKDEISSSVKAFATTTTTTTPTIALLIAPTSNSSIAFSSGRKLKKVKKKFQQFLFPLLLAYKLKFLALIPLLAGGLILLVGSTGLAGFFFALFTAVMSLKGGHENAIVVKKY